MNRTIYLCWADIMKQLMTKKTLRKMMARPSVNTRSGSLMILFLFSLVFLLPLIGSISSSTNSIDHAPSNNMMPAKLHTLELTYYSNWNTTPTPISSDDWLEGDEIILNATVTPVDEINKTLIEVIAPALPATITAEENGSSVEINTRTLGNNATCVINVTGTLDNGSLVVFTLENIFIGNFYTPYVQVISPNGNETWTGSHTITWMAYDNNTGEDLSFEVLLSADSGSTFQLLAANLNVTFYAWDSTGFQNLSTYMIEVRVTDGIYQTSDRSDGTFTAGDVSTTTTPPPTTAPTTATPTAPAAPSLDVSTFITASIIASAILAMVVYYGVRENF